MIRAITPEISKKDRDATDAYTITSRFASNSFQDKVLTIATIHHTVRGYQWANNSCAFDTLFFLQYHLYLLCSESEKILYDTAMPLLGSNFKRQDDFLKLKDVKKNLMLQLSCIKTVKKNLMNACLGKSFLRRTFVEGTFESVDNVLCFFMNLEGESVRVIAAKKALYMTTYSTHTNCIVPECPENGAKHVKDYSLFDQCSLDVKETVQALCIDAEAAEHRMFFCQTCQQQEIRQIDNISTSIFKYIVLPTRFLGTLDLFIVSFGVQYRLVAVSYGNNAHFKGRFVDVDNKVYEYDGMYRTKLGKFEGGCRLVDSSPLFPSMLNNMFRACSLWYKKV